MKTISINSAQRLFVIPCGGGYSCLGFDVAFQRTAAIADELKRGDLAPVESEKETLAGYAAYERAIAAASEYNRKTGYRLKCELTLQLIGLEGKRVEVVNSWGEKERFLVGKSTGFIPCHLMLKNSRSSGGMAVMGAPFQSVRVIG